MDLVTKFSCSFQHYNLLNKSYCAKAEDILVQQKQLSCEAAVDHLTVSLTGMLPVGSELRIWSVLHRGLCSTSAPWNTGRAFPKAGSGDPGGTCSPAASECFSSLRTRGFTGRWWFPQYRKICLAWLVPASSCRRRTCRAELAPQKREAQAMQRARGGDRIHKVFSQYPGANPDLRRI